MTAKSASGLFRATGKRARPVAEAQADGSFLKVEQAERRADDFYPTPPEPVRAFLHAELARIRQLGGEVWENAAGDGAMVRELEAAGLKVFASDLVDRGGGAYICDFYAYKRFAPHRVIVSNPPYAECNWRDGKARWLTHTMSLENVEYVAYLLSWSWFGAGGLARFWHLHPPARVYLMRWKIDFTGDGSPPMLNCWVVWERGRVGAPQLLMLDRKDVRQKDLL